MSRHREPLIVDPAKHPRRAVGLGVAADFLGVHERTVRRRIEEGLLHAYHEGKVYRIRVAVFVRYRHAEQVTTRGRS